MEVFEKIEALYQKADEIANRLREVNRLIDDNKQDLQKYRPEMIMILSDAATRIQKSISDIPRHVHVTHETGLNKQTKILGWAVLLTVILTTAMVTWLMPKGQIALMEYQYKKNNEQAIKLDFFMERNPKTLKAWNDMHKIK